MKLENFIIETISIKQYQLLFNYYCSNKEHLEPWEPTRVNNYYTLDFHINRTNNRIDLIKKKKSMHFILLNNQKTEIIGVCNYTDIKDNECWLGYSISKNYQGLGYMYQALINTNHYMFNKFGIKKINAGIMKNNNRSINLISRLSFKSTTNNNKLEINGKIEKLVIYNLVN